MPAEATHRSDTFRRAQLYTVPVHDVWLKHEASLRAVYEYYSAGDDDLAITQAGQTMGLGEWRALLNDCNLIDADFTRREATLCFFWSLPVTSDEIKRRMWMLNMRFVDFLEVSTLTLTLKPDLLRPSPQPEP